MDVAIGPLRLISAGTGVNRQRDSSPLAWVVQIDYIADDVVELLLGIDPRRDGEIVFA
jgi:hypothetical protein